MIEANLEGANLEGADLAGADLRGARVYTDDQLDAYRLDAAKSLEGATMPNGQKYEDWLRNKKAQGKDEKSE